MASAPEEQSCRVSTLIPLYAQETPGRAPNLALKFSFVIGATELGATTPRDSEI
jgi:hypothetical protein